MNQRAPSPKREAGHTFREEVVYFSRTCAPGLDGGVHVRHAEGRHAREERLGRDDCEEHLGLWRGQPQQER